MFVVVAAGVATTIVTAVVLLWLAYQALEDRSFSEMKNAAETSAAKVEAFFAQVETLGRNMRSALYTEKAAGNPSRESMNALLQKLLEDTPTAVGLATGWEPNAFDGKDGEYKGKPGHDATGRYIPYFARSGGKIVLEPLMDYETPGKGDYYVVPKRTGMDSLTEPYSYPINGKNVLMTSFGTPLFVDGKFAGIADVDIALDAIVTDLTKLKPLGEGYVTLLSRGGDIVSHPDANVLGKSLKDSGLDAAAWQALLANPGSAREVTDPSGVSHMAIAVPVRLLPQVSWFTVVSVPKSVLFANLWALVTTSIVITALAAGLMVAISTLLASRFSRRLDRVITATSEIAQGNTNIDLSETSRNDEIGEMARSLTVLRDATIAKTRLEEEAERNRALQEEERHQRAEEAAERERQTRAAVEALADGLQKLADGDTTHRIEHPFAESFDQIRHDFNAALKRLQETLASVRESTGGISTGTQEIATSAEMLSRRTEQQAASLEETAAALDEVTTTVNKTADSAKAARESVAAAKTDAERSGQVVGQAVEAMGKIEKSSDQISQIIGVIDEIAFQTNLLALNAGVEAARAGDAGRGFAVVASEVRALAQRSAEAAKEIKGLISTSTSEVSEGVKLVAETGGALVRIVEKIGEINAVVADIASGALEQAAGLQQINQAINHMDQVTQQNAAMAEEATAAAQSLAGEGEQLKRLVEQFDVGGVVVQLRAKKAARA
jgi:methyl-accepting chemotaxis protein/methyl-accepting chemotaxis protein-1 (serine sensor receptor)